MIKLTLKEALTIPAEADCITPDNLHNKSNDEIKSQPVYWGNKKLTLGDLFDVEGEKSDEITVIGDCDKVKLIGSQMSFGSIHVKGNVGFNTGSYMTGGKITVDGDARDYLGAMMEGGLVVCKGNAGNFTGGAYKGEMAGMQGGEIIVHGNAGMETGCFMRRGLIVIGGDTDDFAGVFMLAGTILVLGNAGLRAGANMKRGTIILMNETDVLPGFYEGCEFESPAISMILKRASTFGFDTPDSSAFKRFYGDVTSLGKGEILIRA